MKKILLSLTASLNLLIPACTQNNSLEQQILEQTKTHQTVMFGENHSTFEDDKIVISLMPELKKQGYTIFAIELPKQVQDIVDKALFISPSTYAGELMNRTNSSTIWGDGGYSVIREAQKNGFNVVAYDNWDVEISQRDKQAHLSLKELIFNNNPKAKIIIYGGAVHVSESKVFLPSESSQNNSNVQQFIIFTPLGHYLQTLTNKNFSLDLTGKLSQDPDAVIIDKKLIKKR